MIENRAEFLNIISRAYRTLLALTGSGPQAERGAIEMASPIATRLLRARNPRQFELWLAQALLNRAGVLEAKSEEGSSASGEEPGPLPAWSPGADPFVFISSLPQETRIWAALRLANGMSHRLAGEALALNQRGITQVEERFYEVLAGGPSQGGGARPAQTESALGKAVRERQIPESVKAQAQDAISRAERQQRSGAGKVFRPALFAAACSLLIAMVFAGIQVWERLNRFPGSEKAERLLAKTGPAPGKGFDEIEPGPHGLTDWLFIAKPNGLPGSPQNLLGGVRVALSKARHFEFEGAQIVECLDAEGAVAALLFSASQLGLTLEREGEWYRVWTDHWEGAVRREGDGCLLVATSKGREHLESLLAKASQSGAPAPGAAQRAQAEEQGQ